MERRRGRRGGCSRGGGAGCPARERDVPCPEAGGDPLEQLQMRLADYESLMVEFADQARAVEDPDFEPTDLGPHFDETEAVAPPGPPEPLSAEPPEARPLAPLSPSPPSPALKSGHGDTVSLPRSANLPKPLLMSLSPFLRLCLLRKEAPLESLHSCGRVQGAPGLSS